MDFSLYHYWVIIKCIKCLRAPRVFGYKCLVKCICVDVFVCLGAFGQACVVTCMCWVVCVWVCVLGCLSLCVWVHMFSVYVLGCVYL